VDGSGVVLSLPLTFNNYLGSQIDYVQGNECNGICACELQAALQRARVTATHDAAVTRQSMSLSHFALVVM